MEEHQLQQPVHVCACAWVSVCVRWWIIKRWGDIATAGEQCRAPTWVGGNKAIADSWRSAEVRRLPVPSLSTPPPLDNISYLIHSSPHALRHCTWVGLPCQGKERTTSSGCPNDASSRKEAAGGWGVTSLCRFVFFKEELGYVFFIYVYIFKNPVDLSTSTESGIFGRVFETSHQI